MILSLYNHSLSPSLTEYISASQLIFFYDPLFLYYSYYIFICYKYWCKDEKEKKLLENIVVQNEKLLNDTLNNIFENEKTSFNSNIQEEDLIENKIVSSDLIEVLLELFELSLDTLFNLFST